MTQNRPTSSFTRYCFICRTTFHTVSEFTAHQPVLHGRFRYQCGICPELRFDDFADYENHYR